MHRSPRLSPVAKIYMLLLSVPAWQVGLSLMSTHSWLAQDLTNGSKLLLLACCMNRRRGCHLWQLRYISESLQQTVCYPWLSAIIRSLCQNLLRTLEDAPCVLHEGEDHSNLPTLNAIDSVSLRTGLFKGERLFGREWAVVRMLDCI